MANRNRTGKPEMAVALTAAFLDESQSLLWATAIDAADSELSDLVAERARLAGKPTQPALRLKWIDSRIVAETARLKRSEGAFERSRVVVPRPSVDQAHLFGRIVDGATGRGLSKVTVSVVDAAGKTTDKAVTDAVGQFRLTLIPGTRAIVLEVRSGSKLLHHENVTLETKAGERIYREIRIDDQGDIPTKKTTANRATGKKASRRPTKAKSV